MKERKVVFAPQARYQLFELYERLAIVSNPETAIRYTDRIETFCKKLKLASMRGHSRDDIRKGLRIIGFERRVTIAFTVEEFRVIIIGIYYSGQNWQEQFS